MVKGQWMQRTWVRRFDWKLWNLYWLFLEFNSVYLHKKVPSLSLTLKLGQRPLSANNRSSTIQHVQLKMVQCIFAYIFSELHSTCYKQIDIFKFYGTDERLRWEQQEVQWSASEENGNKLWLICNSQAV